ncbi:S1 RNA-binding domain-containing protein [Diplocloster agilis]|uniref:S1 RNA-binding domain-containing protein n=1 Tax=Diplocloster agilis TaxID=2850323 RepID=A0A949NHH8_9FIRM|nr:MULTISPECIES: S1 RNA-binding domain-containing protein [Lachnospiraceae]MBU9738273.1 S1 RNA-binding domain-containing protein [Diplocloster agilis]MBU9745388.1 S1 RNA-binding domain-containing protein [Diplocloster agilis]MCU6736923.1 S1 RNA-binding domain-containing protein [Suonthocola fibrivorans]SCJ94483.1 30S ribosomal protein S1 [uncultured Clostridium sp.]
MSEEQKVDVTPVTEEGASMEDYATELEASFKEIVEGEIMTGVVIAVGDEDVTVDLKYYTEGIIPLDKFSREPGYSLKEHVAAGDEISAAVVKKDDGQGHILLSKIEADDELAWDKLRQLQEEGTVLTVTVKGVVKSGVVAYVEGIRGFIPASKLSLNYVEDLNEFLNKEIQVKVLDVVEEDKRLILSAREILREQAAEERKARISNVQVGLVTEGTVESIQPYGAFINLGSGLSGLVHVSQISEKRIKSPDAVLKVGDKVKVKVIAVKEGKLSLSMKALHDATAQEVVEESYDLPQSEGLSTNLGSLFKNLKLDL